MKKHIPLLLLIFVTLFYCDLHAEEVSVIVDKKLTTDMLIKASLEDDVSPNSSVGRKIVLVVDEDVKNKSLDAVLIPRYTRIICKQNEIKRLDTIDVVFADCNKLFFPNGKVIDFRGNIFNENLKSGMSTPKNVTISKGAKLIVKLETSLTLD